MFNKIKNDMFTEISYSFKMKSKSKCDKKLIIDFCDDSILMPGNFLQFTSI